MPAANISQTSPNHWRYVSEGGATIVFSYIGPSNPQLDGMVLRLRKAIVPHLPPAVHSIEEASTEVYFEPDDPTIEYQAKCMARLIPVEHLPRLETVLLERPWLEQFHLAHQHDRPAVRREKDSIDLNRKKGVLATDLVGSAQIAVEIKPKWAFLPSPTHLSDATRPVKTQTCRFCMHSSLKSSHGKKVAGGYCPLDLFSGDESRITHAINCLWDAWAESEGTINNLKIFVRGKPLDPSEAHSLLPEGIEPAAYSQDLRGTFTSALRRSLLGTPVLRILSKLQRTLDVLDIEGLAKLWRLTETSALLYRTTFASFFEKDQDSPLPPQTPLGVTSLFLSEPEPNISDWTDFLDNYLSPSSAQLDNEHPEPQNLRYYLLAYLLSATFKDCSIIVRLQSLEPDVGGVKPGDMTVIDLDPKSMDKLRGWEKLDREIATAYAAIDEPRRCVDGWVAERG